ncbi:hypothetical protein RB195_022025 [Necator americanus]|uniref:Uncharacterized protein n=1 Tax=Necator americanus TaxID=51031 RepID=A0ABR1EDP4_NECAM
MYHDIYTLSPEQSFIRFKEINSEPKPSAEWLAKKKKLRNAWLTSQPKTTTTTAALSDQFSTLLFAVLGFLVLVTLIGPLTCAVKRNAVKRQRNPDREVQGHLELIEQSLRSKSLLLEIKS